MLLNLMFQLPPNPTVSKPARALTCNGHDKTSPASIRVPVTFMRVHVTFMWD